jgi:hypothetical protein
VIAAEATPLAAKTMADANTAMRFFILVTSFATRASSCVALVAYLVARAQRSRDSFAIR